MNTHTPLRGEPVKLQRLSVCQCGFGLLDDSIPLGTEYRIEPDRKDVAQYVCGHCDATRQIETVFAYDRHDPDFGGFLPAEIFLPQN